MGSFLHGAARRARRALLLAVLLAGAGVIATAQQKTGANQAPKAPERLPEIRKTASVAGIVTGPTGAPIARARVLVSAHEVYECPPDATIDKIETCPRYNRIAQTDAEGRWAVDTLPKGVTYQARATKSGYADGGYQETGPQLEPARFTLADDEHRTDINIRLTPETWLTGEFFDADKTPMAGVLIEAYRRLPDGTTQMPSVVQAVTDERGTFRLHGLRPGPYVLGAADPALARAGDDTGPADFGQTFYPDRRDAASATVIDVQANGTTPPVRFALLPGIPVHTPLPPPPPPLPTPTGKNAAAAVAARRAPPPPPTASMSGRVTSLATGAPVARVRVVLSSDDLFTCAPGTPADQTATCPRYNRVAITDAQGRYTFDKLPKARTYLVTATKTGFAPRAYGELPPAGVPKYVALRDAEEVANIDIALAPENFISGAVLDEDDTPMAGALVEAQRAVYDANGRRTFVSCGQVVTDDRGNFRITNLGPGQYFVTAFDPNYAGVGDRDGQLFYGPTFYPGTVFEDDAVRVTLDPGVPVEGLKFQLTIIRPARLRGRLIAPGLQLLAGAVNIGPSRSTRSGSFAQSDADIKPDGLFQFANILAERYVIRARAAVETDGLSHFALWTQPIEGLDITGVDMTLAPGARLNGRVIWESRQTAQPADITQVRVRAPMADGSSFGDVLSGKIDTDGRYSLMGAMAGTHYIRIENLPDPWILKRVTARGADITDTPFTVEYRQLYDGIDVTVTDVTTTLSGTVSVAAGDLTQAYAVIAFPTNRLHWHPVSRHIRITYADDKGRYVIKGLPQAEYYVAVTRAADESDITSPVLLERLSLTAQTVRLVDGERRTMPLIAKKPKR